MGRDQRAEINGIFHKGNRPLREEERPKRLKLRNKSNFAKLRKWFLSDLGSLVVHPIVKEVVETLEPGTHQFMPIELWYAKSQIFEEPWFLLNVTQRIDSIDQDRSAVTMKKGFGEVARPDLSILKEQVAIFSNRSEGKHLWRDETFPRPLLISDELWKRLKKENVLIRPSFETLK